MKTTRQHIKTLTGRAPIGAYSDLIGREDLALIIEEVTEALEPCARPVARAEAKRLAACYPTLRPTPEWLGQIEEALKPAPCDLIEKAVSRLSGEATFPPNKAQMARTVEHLVAVRRAVLIRAKAMLREHERRASELVEETSRREAREAFRKKLAGRSPLEFIRQETKE